MPPVVIDVRRAADPRDVVHRAVQAVAEGLVVAFPTETVYGLAASALNESAVERLVAAKGRRPGHPMALAVKSADAAMDYVPDISELGRRLARRCWPGPLTLVLGDEHPESLVRQLPERVQATVSPSGTIGLRVPAHWLMIDVLHLLAGPLVLTSANRTGEKESVTAEQVAESLGEDVQLVLDDGRSKFGQISSVVRVRPQRLDILRLGVVPEKTLKRLASLIVLFVCTGNTCRSPMAAELCLRRIAKRLGCEAGEVEDRGVIVASAGIAAMAGGHPSAEAVEVMARRGLDLSEHESQPLSERLVRHADLVLAMTRAHRDAIVAQWPHAAGRIRLLRADGGDIADPIGGTAELYLHCADQIDAELEHHVGELDLSDVVVAGQPEG